MKFSSGKVTLELLSEAGVVVLEHEGQAVAVGAINVPRGWEPDLDQFTRWCCRFLGMVMDDQPIFTVDTEPSPRSVGGKDFFVVGLSGPIDRLPKGTVLAPVPEASP